ncbi:hypothetical protein C8P70_1497 [Myroides indicus]|uniref:Uncharacterized protein n=1 Tax=Myroides indicus TaxID=1323422 RepID=A0A4R7ES46_9FLAO|nr:hypothetical protein C8P70_1497 [Myroides indicus]
MKQIVCLFMFLLLISCKQTKLEQEITIFSDTISINNNSDIKDTVDKDDLRNKLKIIRTNFKRINSIKE